MLAGRPLHWPLTGAQSQCSLQQQGLLVSMLQAGTGRAVQVRPASAPDLGLLLKSLPLVWLGKQQKAMLVSLCLHPTSCMPACCTDLNPEPLFPPPFHPPPGRHAWMHIPLVLYRLCK